MQPLQFDLSEQRTRNFTYSPFASSYDINQNLIELNNNTTDQTDYQQRRLRFDIVLEAATAITQKSEESTITYLNKGQTYGIQLTDKQASNVMITSTLSIDFHLPSHRMVAESYWTFWVTQQKESDPRAIELDTTQSSGITDMCFPTFNKITFKWNGRYGAKLLVRFKCLSTDFSRIKGVKGIPLRAQMESMTMDTTSFNEACYCRIKLFRDKGAERKNKDDVKQITKQLEKVYGKANDESLPLMYNASLPYSVFSEIPVTATASSEDKDSSSTVKKKHTRVMTAPNSLFHNTKRRSPLLSTDLTSNNARQYDYVSSPISPITTEVTTPVKYSDPLSVNYDPLVLQQPELMLYPTIDTGMKDLSLLDSNGHHLPPMMWPSINLDDDLVPPLTADYNPTSLADRIDFPNNTMVTPELVMGSTLFHHPPSTSIYDVFSPEEIQQTTYQQEDYFCDNKISLLQQQLQLHTKNAYDIVLHSNLLSDMYTSAPQEVIPSSKKRTRECSIKEDQSSKKHRS